MINFFVNDKLSQVISAQIASEADANQREFLEAVISEFENSERRKFMDVAQRYYENKNDILQARRTVIGKDENNNAVLMESRVLSNNRLCHNFMKKLTRQKIGYMLGKPFVLSSIKPDDTKAEQMFKELNSKYFTREFFKLIKNVARDSIVKGIGWLLVYYDENGRLRFMRCNPEEIIPFWADSDHTELDAVVRKYTIEKYTGGKKDYITYVEYYTKTGVYFYKYDESGKLVKDPDHPTQPEYQFYVKTIDANTGEETVTGSNWTDIPLIPFKYDPDEQSLLTRIKTLIDDYDKKTSEVANAIDDIPNSLLLVKGYDGASKEEFVHNKNQYRTIFVTDEGDAKTLETPLNVEDIDIHIQRLREDIYEFGQGVNTADKDIRDTSGVALRFMYADLDMDCVDWGSEVQWSLMRLIWFIQQDIKAKSGIDYSDIDYEILFNTDVIINETETINNCAISAGIISGETIAANHPWTKDAKKEIATMRQEQTDTLELETEYGDAPETSLIGQRIGRGDLSV